MLTSQSRFRFLSDSYGGSNFLLETKSLISIHDVLPVNQISTNKLWGSKET